MKHAASSAERAPWRRRRSLQTRLVGFTAPILVVALTTTMTLAAPVWTLPDRVQAVEVGLERALEAHALGTIVTEQSKHFLEYIYVDEELRADLRADIARSREEGDLLVPGAPAQIQQLWREFHVSGDAMVRFVDDGNDGVLSLAMLSVVPTSDALAKATHRHADESQAQAQQALDRITGVWSLLPSSAGALGESLERIADDSHKALAATHARHSAMHFLSAFPALLAGTSSHPEEAAAAAAVETGKVLARLAGSGDLGQASQVRAAQLQDVLGQLRSDGRVVAELAEAGDVQAATQHFVQVLERRSQQDFFPGLTELVDLHRASLATATQDAIDSARVLQAVLLSGSALFVLVVLGAGVRLLRGVVVPMRDLERAHRRLADGDTTTRILPGAAGPLGVLGTSFNLLAEELATGSSARLAKAVLDHSDDVLLVVDDGVVRWASPATEQLAGGVAGVVGSPIDRLLVDGGRTPRQDGEVDDVQLAGLRRADGAVGRYELTWVDLRHDPQIRAHLLLARDVTARAHQQAELSHRAAHDELTGLPNRTSATDVLEQLAGGGRGVAMLFCDIDNFKDVNDGLGHAAGDTLLVEVAERLLDVGRAFGPAVVARLGGDEFVILLPDQGALHGERVAAAVDAALRAPFVVEHSTQTVSCSIGLAVAPSGAPWDPAGLLREADLAMYQAKRDGRGRMLRFTSGMQDELMERLRLDRALAHDVAGCVRVHFQPVVDAADGRPVAVEALLRWQDGERLVPPEVVVARAEATRTIHAIGLQVLRVAAAQVAAWRADVAPGLCLAVNVSVVELERASYTEDVLRILAAVGLPPSTLTIEVTESAFSFDDRTLLENLRGLRSAGIALSIDDFGTGWSSLSRLQLVSPAEIKIDRSFVSPLAAESDVSLVRAVLAVSRELGCRVVAEGVEREEQRVVLGSLGVDLMQGYLFGRPVDAQEAEAFLAGAAVLLRLPRQGEGDRLAARPHNRLQG